MKFQPTGNTSVDKILSAIEHAARENKNSDHWADHDVGEVSDLEMIQEAACEARGEVEQLMAEVDRIANTLRDRIDEFGSTIDSLDKILKGDPEALAMDVKELARERMAEVEQLKAVVDLYRQTCPTCRFEAVCHRCKRAEALAPVAIELMKRMKLGEGDIAALDVKEASDGSE